MADIDDIELRRLDLSLLLIFLSLMRTGQAAATAGEMGLAQSSISHALRRLREIFDDPLFLRRAHGLTPTARAEALRAPVAEAVELIADALHGARAFDPAASQAVVRIAAHDYHHALLAPRLTAALARAAPGIRLILSSEKRGAALQALHRGEVDLAVGYFPDPGPNILADIAYRERFVAVARRGHQDVDAPLSLSAYLAAEHVLVSPSGDLTGVADDTLAALGERRVVRAAVAEFLPALATVAATDLIATIPAQVAKGFADRFDLMVLEAPIEVRPFEVAVLRRRADEKSGLHLWMRDQVIAALT